MTENIANIFSVSLRNSIDSPADFHVSEKVQKSKMSREDFIVLNSVPTHILTYGKWITDEFNDEIQNELILVIPGNPGYPFLYRKFCETIYEEFQGRTSIWVIGHAGKQKIRINISCMNALTSFSITLNLTGFCDPPPDKQMKMPGLKGNETLFNFEGQLSHKVAFIEKYLPTNVKIYLVGHSMGSKLCLELLKIPRLNVRVKKCYLLFPVIERVEESRKGKLFPTYDSIFFLFVYFFHFLNLIPSTWKNSTVKMCMRLDGHENYEFFDAARDFMDPKLSRVCWFLMIDMIEKFKELDENIVMANVEKLKLYYAQKDDWVAHNFYHEIVDRIPGIDAEMCKNGFEHAFVFKNSIEVGQMLCEWIKGSESGDKTKEICV